MKPAVPRGICALALLYAAQGVPAHAQTGKVTLIRHVRVFDGQSVINDTSLLITNGNVAAIGRRLSVPRGTTVVEGKGRTLLPGLIDSHTHIRSRQDLEQSLALGVTSDISRLTPLGALVTATSASATAFRLSDRGRIAPGFRADLLLVNGNPTEDVRATRDIEQIWKAGIPFNRQQWLNRSQQKHSERF